MLSSDINAPVEWRNVVGFEGVYEVSNDGQVRSISGRIRKPFVRDNGYRAIYLTHGLNRKCLLVHSMVLTAFCGFRPADMVCRHLDGNPANNHLSNLRWGTSAENSNDCRLHGRTPAGAKNPHARLTAAAVESIRKTDMAAAELAVLYCVSRRAINNVRKGITWTSL